MGAAAGSGYLFQLIDIGSSFDRGLFRDIPISKANKAEIFSGPFGLFFNIIVIVTGAGILVLLIF